MRAARARPRYPRLQDPALGVQHTRNGGKLSLPTSGERCSPAPLAAYIGLRSAFGAGLAGDVHAATGGLLAHRHAGSQGQHQSRHQPFDHCAGIVDGCAGNLHFTAPSTQNQRRARPRPSSGRTHTIAHTPRNAATYTTPARVFISGGTITPPPPIPPTNRNLQGKHESLDLFWGPWMANARARTGSKAITTSPLRQERAVVRLPSTTG